MTTIVQALVENAIANGGKRGRAIVLLERARTLLKLAEMDLRGDAPLEEVHTTLDILTGATSQAITDIAAEVERGTHG